MKRIVSIKVIFAIIATIFINSFFLESALALTEGDWEFELQSNVATITGYNGPGGKVIIPSVLRGATVIDIEGANIFKNKNVTSITFPGTIKTIHGICYYVSSLEEIILEEGVKTIERLKNYENGAFQGCTNLKTIKLPSSLTKIGDKSFLDCRSLSNVIFPKNLRRLGREAFSHSGLISIDISETNISSVDSYAFSSCKSLVSVKLNNLINVIPSYSFSDCNSLNSINLPSNITKIDDLAFCGCASLDHIILPSNLKTIGIETFSKCDMLKEIIIPYGTEEISSTSFINCKKLEGIYVPDTVKEISGNWDITKYSPNAAVYCNRGSAVANHCTKYGGSYIYDSSVNSYISVLYNNKRVSFGKYGQNPVIVNGHTLVHVRAISEAMSANVEWDAVTRTVNLSRNGITVSIQLESDKMYVNDKEIKLNIPAQLINGNTMIPLRAVTEAFNVNVEWNADGNVVLISD